jgi:hypothetical protein
MIYDLVNLLKGENVNRLFFRLASILFNESINREIDEKHLKRSIGETDIKQSISSKKSSNSIKKLIFDFLFLKIIY